MNSPRLRPYHNPENVDESRVPKGWRFLYENEFSASWRRQRQTRQWVAWRDEFHLETDAWGNQSHLTYIVPVA